MQKDLKNKTLAELEEIVVSLGGKKYFAKYIFSFIHSKDAISIEDITPLSKAFRQKLTEQDFYISQLTIIEKFKDPDGTIKFLFELNDGMRIESVLLTNDGPGERRTLCISCQAGCRMGCKFCATGQLKFQRDLSAGEIVDQVNKVAKDKGKINNVVYMGMGEAFDNYNNSIRSVYIINHHAGKFIGQRHITLSTCGITEGIDKLAMEDIQPRLAISLHGPTDQIRSKIMTICGKYPLEKLMASLKKYQQKTKKRITFEYCMIKGLNDSREHAGDLVKLLSGFKTSVNLIEYNSHPGCKFKPSPKNNILTFRDTLMQSGVETVIRYKRGQKIKAACGQLGATWLTNK